jgi:hypothetical protein
LMYDSGLSTSSTMPILLARAGISTIFQNESNFKKTWHQKRDKFERFMQIKFCTHSLISWSDKLHPIHHMMTICRPRASSTSRLAWIYVCKKSWATFHSCWALEILRARRTTSGLRVWGYMRKKLLCRKSSDAESRCHNWLGK